MDAPSSQSPDDVSPALDPAGVPIRTLVAAFLILSLLDFSLTWLLLAQYPEVAYEANPFAAATLKTHGWFGLGVYKALLTGAVLSVALVVHRRRPAAGRPLLACLCGAVLPAVGYSVFFLLGRPANPDEYASLAELRAHRAQVDTTGEESQGYGTRLESLAAALAERQVTLIYAVTELERTVARHRHHSPFDSLRVHYPGLSDRACLAATLVRRSGDWVRDDPIRQRLLLDSMTRDFERLCQSGLPEFARQNYLPPPGAVESAVALDAEAEPTEPDRDRAAIASVPTTVDKRGNQGCVVGRAIPVKYGLAGRSVLKNFKPGDGTHVNRR